jgi:methyl-accepting chemotaxis protein
VSALNLKIHPDFQNTTYSTEEEDDSGIHFAYYDVNERNFTHLHLTKKWSSDDYLKHADGRPVEGVQHSKSHYYTSLEIQDGVIKNAKRTHFSYLWSEKPYNRPLNGPAFQQQPDLEIKVSGESHLNLIRCVSPKSNRVKRSSEKLHLSLENLKQDTLGYGEIHHLKWSSVGDPNKPSRTFYELVRCYSDPSVKESELSQCIKELHYLAKIDDKIFRNIVNLTLERSHLNFSTWSGLVGAVVVRGDYETQKILSGIILSDKPRPLSDKEYAKLLEAVYFIPSGPLYLELLEALLSLQMNSSKSDEITVRAMLVTSALVRKCHDAGYNRSLSERIAQHLHQSFKTHPARFRDEESQSHDEYIWSHVCAFGNLGHISSLDLITRYLDHDSSGIRYFAVLAFRKLPTQYTDHHLIRVLRSDEQITVKAGVIEVFIERRQNLTDELRDAIEDALWIAEEGDELDSRITEFLENHNDKSHHVIKKLRKRRSIIRRKKRALFPALKPREFSLGVQKEWRRAFGGRQAGAETIMRYVNQVKLRVGIFGGNFEVDIDNSALFRAHVIKWSFDIVKGKAAFKMGAGFKNDIPKYLIHTVADSVDSFLAKADAISSIFTQHIQIFLDKLKSNLPFNPGKFQTFISKADEFIRRAVQVKRFGNFFNRMVIKCRSASRASEFWEKIRNSGKKLSLNLPNINLSKWSLRGQIRFLGKLFDVFSRLRFRFKICQFNVTLNFIPTLDKFKITTLRLVHFGNSFLDMLSLFRDMFNIDLPRLYLPEFNPNVFINEDLDFGLPFDWRKAFNFNIDFSGPDFAKFRNLFRILTEVFLNLRNPNVNFEQFFNEILPDFKIKFESIGLELFRDENNSNVEQWFQLVVKIFHGYLNQLDRKLFDLSHTASFLEELSNIVGDFSEGAFTKTCQLQNFMSKSAGMLEAFGQNLEKDIILGIKNVRNEAHQAIGEVVRISSCVDQFIDELQNVSSTVKTFVEQHLTSLERSLENVEELADLITEFSANSTAKFRGLCYKTVNISGAILDKIQSEAKNAVEAISGFLISSSGGLSDFISQFKEDVVNLEKWHLKYLAKNVGKVGIISKTIDEFLSLIKSKSKSNIFSDIQKVFRNIDNVIRHLNNLPTHAQKGYAFADKVIDFATNAKRWKTEFGKLDIKRKFNLDFDEQLRKLCDEFHSLAEDTTKQIKGGDLFKLFHEFITRETDSFILQSINKINRIKAPLEKARGDLEEMSNAVEEIEAVLPELRPFSDNFSPVLQEIRQLKNCSDIYVVFDDIITRCGKGAISFGRKAYSEYTTMKSEVEAFLELLPDEWESLTLQKCYFGGPCLSNALKRQAKSVSIKMEKLKKKFNGFDFLDKLETCKDRVEDVSGVFDRIKNISKLVKEFSFNKEVTKIKDLSRRITGKFFGNDESQVSCSRFAFLLYMSSRGVYYCARKNAQLVINLQQTCSNAVATTCYLDVSTQLIRSLMICCQQRVDGLLNLFEVY